MYLSAATNRITVTWGNYGKVCAEGDHRELRKRVQESSLAHSFPSFSHQSYSVGLYLVRQMTSAELLQRLKTIGVKHPELCKALGEYSCVRSGVGRSAVCLSDCSIPTSRAARNALGNSCQVLYNFFPAFVSKHFFYLNRLAKLYVSRVKLPPACVQVQRFCSACFSWLCRSSESL